MWMRRSYLVQYTALMMILLLMLLASYAARNHRKYSKPITSPLQDFGKASKNLPLQSAPILRMGDLFLRNQSALNPARAKALAQLLGQHDLKGRLEISAAKRDGIMLALLRSRALALFLSSQKIPLDEVQILARSRPVRPGAQLEFYAENAQ